MLYTGKGDSGKTGTFGTKEKVSKSSSVTETLGSLDEANSFIGLAKAKLAAAGLAVAGERLADTLHRMQNDLFIVQAEVAGADKRLAAGEVARIEAIVGAIERELPPVKSFFIPGASELAAVCDVARTLVRRAERRLVGLAERRPGAIDPASLAFLNRLSSLLYACARYAAKDAGGEPAPTY